VFTHTKFGPKTCSGLQVEENTKATNDCVFVCECLLIAMETHLHPPISVGNRHPERVIGLA